MNLKSWETVASNLLNELKEGESLSLSLGAEDSLFMRMTQAKVRQVTQIEQGKVTLHFFKNNRNLKVALPFTFNTLRDTKAGQDAIVSCRNAVQILPEDPFIQLPVQEGQFHQEASVSMDRDHLMKTCLEQAKGVDFVGLLTAGEIVRANRNSAGLNQWFKTSTFSVDFSLYAQNNQATKGLYGGRHWHDHEFQAIMKKKLAQLEQLSKPIMTLKKAKYRTYFSPSAVATLMSSLWGFASRDAYQRGQCAFKKLVDGDKHLSPHFSLRENFTGGETPPFNEMGEMPPEILAIVENGHFKNLLCSTRSAKEYNLPSNFASSREGLRSPEILAGHIAAEKELETLGTGIYVSDLHYLNWSDVQQGSITGMTRFGCFWVEKGQIVAPIKDLRFDETLYHFWGTGLEGFTNKIENFPSTGTYYHRSLGIVKAPGMLVNDFTFVL